MQLATGLLIAAATPTFACGPATFSAPPQSWHMTAAPGSPIAGLPKVNALGIGDFNGDGRPDLAAVNGDPGELLILINQGEGRFTPARSATDGDGRIHVGETASGLIVADVNRDAAPEILICFHDRDEIAVLLTARGAGFQAPRMTPISRREHGSPHVHNLAFADINNDDQGDVIVAQADDNAIVWALGDGDGTFAPAGKSFPADDHPYTIVAADFNNDRRIDVASPNANSVELTIGLNDGAGGFVPPSAIPHSSDAQPLLSPRTLALAAGDINGDGNIDLVGSSDEQQQTLFLLLGDGRGNFARSGHSFAAAARCYNQLVADINGDGRTDVIAPCIDRSSVVVWLAEDPAALRFRRMEFGTPGTDSQVLALGDLNGDDMTDVASAGWSTPSLTILLGTQAAETSNHEARP